LSGYLGLEVRKLLLKGASAAQRKRKQKRTHTSRAKECRNNHAEKEGVIKKVKRQKMNKEQTKNR